MNIETTAVDNVWITDDDFAYIEGEGMTRDQVQGNELRNLSNREIIGSLLFLRSFSLDDDGTAGTDQKSDGPRACSPSFA
jgi:hypothetical protein